MKRTKFIIPVVIIVSLTMTFATVFAATKEVSVFVNDVKVIFDQPAINKNGTVFVPIRGILEVFGQEVAWDEKTMTMTATDKNTGMVTTIDTNSPVVKTSQNKVEREYTMTTAPILIKSRTLIPVRAISEIFAKDVSWDQKTATVSIKDSTGRALDKTTTSALTLKDMVSVQYATDGTYDCVMAANADFIFVNDVAEGVGLHTMYFRAEAINKDAKIEIQKVAEGKILETTTYKASIADPYEIAQLLSSDSAIVNDVKVGDYVKATVVNAVASTGYQWFVSSLPAGLQQVDVKESAVTKEGLVGAPTEMTFVFKVVDQGDMNLELTNKRAWEDKNQDSTVVKYALKATK